MDAVLIPEDALRARVQELGAQITRDYEGRPLVLICVLKGAVAFFADLARAIALPAQLDFISISSYGASTQTSGVVRFLKDLDAPIEGKDVLIIEDIVDTGLTLRYILDNFTTRQPASIRICGLLLKDRERLEEVTVDYVGFRIPDKFVVGYGLDFAERYRNLPYIGVLKPSVYREVG
ncbi:MAG: hypoxanthine phosphoribosyltransferase [Chloroflexota bacterium]